MLDKTLCNALNTYRVHILSGNGQHTTSEIGHILEHIKSCEEYIKSGNKINGTWMAENHIILSKAVKCAHDFVHRNYEENDDLREEHREINQCMTFFKEFYEKHGIDPNYMSI